MTELLGFHHVALTGSDCDASAEWYASVLGFEELFSAGSATRNPFVWHEIAD